jgi:arylsulfatase A-like enzyme
MEAPQRYINQYPHIGDPNRRKHAAQTAVMDELIGKIEGLLKSYGYWNNSVIIFSADNGGHVQTMGLNWPLRGGKGTVFEGGTKLVAFVNSPLIPTGTNRISRALIHGVDWYPTFLRLATGAPPDPSAWPWLDGINQWETILQASMSPGPRTEFIYNIDPLIKSNGYLQAAIRVGDWKLITGNPCNSGGDTCGWVQEPSKGPPVKSPKLKNTIMLFNLTADPFEKDDVSEANPSVVKSLLARMAVYNSTMVAPLNEPPDPACNPKKFGGVWQPWRT